MPYLVVEKSRKSHKIFMFSAKIQIGRGQENDIILCDEDDSSISRAHSYINKEAGTYILYDTSSNGTYIDGQVVKKCLLADGTRFQINNYNFTFIDDSADRFGGGPSNKKKNPNSFNDEKTIFTATPQKNLEQKLKLKKKLRSAGIIAENDAMLALFLDLKEVVRINVPVLILGESGTGKEIVAQILHKFAKSSGEFVALNCSAIPEGIFENELFGSVKGAFHDARDKPGKLEMANNGTVFLDEIGDMNLAIQPKLLRFLEDHKVTRLGDTRVKTINSRIIAATNQDLKSMMKKGLFRRDLYQRLACITLHIPPLRERKEDIIPLANLFLKQSANKYDLGAKKLSNDAERQLISYHWPDNVRELKNILLTTLVRSKGATINVSDLPLPSENTNSETTSIQRDELWSMEEMEKHHILRALKQSSGVKLKAASLLGISRDTLYKKIKKYQIN